MGFVLNHKNASVRVKTAALPKNLRRNKNGALFGEDTAQAKFKPKFPLIPRFRSIEDRTVFIRTLRNFRRVLRRVIWRII